MFARSVSPPVPQVAGARVPVAIPDALAPAVAGPESSPRPGPDRLDGLLAQAVLQRKVAFDPEAVDAKSVHARLLERAAILPEGAEGLLRSTLNVEKVATGLERLRGSATDYGTFDLTLDDALALLFYELRKHVEKPRTAEDPAEELTAVAAEEEATGAFAAYAAKSPSPEATFELAFLGAGAATAYYMTSATGLPPRSRTIVVGPLQPWAQERGPGVINHPMHMISPRRDAVGLGDESLAPRRDFSVAVEEVLAEHAAHRSTAKIKSVKKITNEEHRYYEIALTSDGGAKVIYARKVVAGLGIGPHLRGGLNAAGKTGEQDPLLDLKGQAHALDLDEYQRLVPDLVGRPTVVISGPNAGIDAVKTSMERRFDIVWVLGATGKPGLLPGTDNEIVEEEYLLRGVEGRTPLIRQYVQGRASGAVRAPEHASKPIVVKIAGKDDVPADYYVMATGPDVAKMSAVFDEETIRKQLVPTYDRNRQFDDPRDGGLATVVGIEVQNTLESDETQLEIIGGSAYRMAMSADLKVPYDYLRRQWQEASSSVSQMSGLEGRFAGMSASAEAKHPEVVEAMSALYGLASRYRFDVLGMGRSIQNATSAGELPTLPPVPNFGPPSQPLLDALKLSGHEQLDKPRQDVVTGFVAMLRVLENYGRMLALYRDTVGAYLVKPGGPDPRLAGSHMTGVIRSLPLNVLMNDQLTPTRSQIEGRSAFVPTYVAKDVNFATDSATVLQIHIATKYPDISDSEVDMWVDRIIRWRRPEDRDGEWKDYPSLKGPLPNPHGKSRDRGTWFSERFETWLAEANEAAKQRKRDSVLAK